MRVPATLLAALLVAAGGVGVAAAATQTPGGHQRADRTTVTLRNATSLLTRAEVLDALGENGTGATAHLYYVPETGTWHHALPNGTIEGEAPDGDVVPNVVVGSGASAHNETIDVPPDRRPVYVWKVTTADGCETRVVDATNASTIATYAIPGCAASRPPTPTPPTPTASPTPTATTSATPTATATGGQPGFGLAAGALALLAAGWLARRR